MPPPGPTGPPRWNEPLPQRESPFDLSPEIEGLRRASAERGYYDSELDRVKMGQKQQADEYLARANAENEASFRANADARETDEAQYAKDADELYGQVQKEAGKIIDPGSFFSEKGTWANIAMAISMGLAGYLNPRGPNMALEIIEKNMDRWIDAKKTNIENRRKEGYEKIQALQGKAAVLNRLRDTAEWKRATVYEMASNQAKLMASQTTDKEIKARADQFQAMAKENAAKEMYQSALKGGALIAGIMRSKIAAGPAYAAVNERRRQDVTWMPFKMLDKTWQNRTNDARTEIQRDKVGQIQQNMQSGLVPVQGIDGEILGTTRKEAWKGVQDKMYAFQTVDRTLSEIENITGSRDLWDRRPDLINLGDQSTHELKQLYNHLTLQLATLEQRGANFTENEERLIHEQTGDADTWNTKDYGDRLSSLRKAYAREADGFLKSHITEHGHVGPNTPKNYAPKKATPKAAAPATPATAAPTATPNDDDWNNIPSIK